MARVAITGASGLLGGNLAAELLTAGHEVTAIRRANTMVLWADRLIEQAVAKKMDVSDIEREQKVARTMLAEAKVGWHAFNLDPVQRKADQAFETSNRLKDSFRAKLFP